MTESDLRSEIASLGEQIDALVERRVRLIELLDGPRVLAVAHYWRYQDTDEAEFDSVTEALRFLAVGEDDGSLSAEGVSVGGHMLTAQEEEEHGGRD